MSRHHEETVAVDYERVVARTELAVKLRLPDGREVWFPLSRCEDLVEVEVGHGPGEFECPAWLAEEKGLA